MGVLEGPGIANNGLILCYDKYNEDSYPGEPTTNLIDNGGFEVDNSGWTNNQTATWERVYHNDRWCLKCTMNQNSSTPGIKQNTWSFPVLPNTTYRFTALVDKGTIGSGVAMYIRADQGDNVLLNAGTSASNGIWTENSYTFTTSSNHTALDYVMFYANMNGQLSGQYFFIDDVQIEIDKGHTTKFVDGTRSVTDGFTDLSPSGTHADLTQLSYSATNVPGTDRNNFTFDGTDDAIYINGSSIGYITDVSVFSWYKKTSNTAGGGYHIISATTALELSLQQTGDYLRNGVYTVGGGRYVDNQGSGLNNFDWHYVGLTYDSSTSVKTAYIDGVAVGTRTTDGSALLYDYGGREIGGWGASYFLAGEVATYSIYNRALTSTEVKQNYDSHKHRYI